MSSLRTASACYDAIVVGARVAGAATAMLLARHGLRVLAFDRSSPGADALSTHALMRAGVLQLSRWGLLDALERAGTPRVQTATFHYGERKVVVPIKPRGRVPALYAPRRTVLDPLLVEAARASGVQVRHGLRLVGLLRSAEGRVTGVRVQDAAGEHATFSAPLVIGADGTKSSVARLVGAAPYREGRHASAYVYGYFDGLDNDGYHYCHVPGVAAGYLPTNHGESCVFVGTTPERHARELRADPAGAFHRVLREADPQLAERVRDARPSGGYCVFSGVRGYVRQSVGEGWALVGDAAYFKDPITAHGMSDALRDAELLARAVVRGSEAALVDYPRVRDALSMRLFEISDAIASFEWDLPRVEELQLELADAMKAENAWIESLDPRATPTAA